jgi:hypothetical protein
MPMQVFTVGQVLSAADTNEYFVNTRYASKPSDTSRISTVTLAADPDLTLPVDANKTYMVESFVQYTAIAGTGDIKATWSAPAGATFNGMGTGVMISSGNYQEFAYGPTGNLLSTTVAYDGGGALLMSFRLSGMLVVSSTSGSLTFNWAQNTSNGTATVVKAGSSMFLRRVS